MHQCFIQFSAVQIESSVAFYEILKIAQNKTILGVLVCFCSCINSFYLTQSNNNITLYMYNYDFSRNFQKAAVQPQGQFQIIHSCHFGNHRNPLL